LVAKLGYNAFCTGLSLPASGQIGLQGLHLLPHGCLGFRLGGLLAFGLAGLEGLDGGHVAGDGLVGCLGLSGQAVDLSSSQRGALEARVLLHHGPGAAPLPPSGPGQAEAPVLHFRLAHGTPRAESQGADR